MEDGLACSLEKPIREFEVNTIYCDTKGILSTKRKMKKFFSLYFSRQNTHIPLLIFLIFFLNVKFVVKIGAILFMMFYSMNFRFGFSGKNSRLPLFYLLIIFVECLKYLVVTRNFGLEYGLVFSLGMLQWGFCLLSIHYLKSIVEQTSPLVMHQTIKTFYLLNFGVSLFFLALLLLHPSWLAYWGQGENISMANPSAGDAIIGISFDNSSVNATINALGLIYFLYKKEYVFSLLCLLIIVFCTSNASFLFILFTLLLMILTIGSSSLRIRSLLAALTLIVLYFSFSPSNRDYFRNYFVQLDILNKNPKLFSTGPVADSVYAVSPNRQSKSVGHLFSLHNHSRIIRDSAGSGYYLYISNTDYDSKPGKLISFLQTYVFLQSKISHLIFGAGIGNFSSKLAFRASGVHILGSYPSKYTYASTDFKNNHLRSFEHYIHGPPSQHTVLNFPFSVYNQILGEYGLTGALLFAVFYLGYFLKHLRRLSYGRFMLIALMGFFLMDYWFESFSLVVIFELFLLLNMKEGVSSTLEPTQVSLQSNDGTKNNYEK
jgi:hypothetical protein